MCNFGVIVRGSVDPWVKFVDYPALRRIYLVYEDLEVVQSLLDILYYSFLSSSVCSSCVRSHKDCLVLLPLLISEYVVS